MTYTKKSQDVANEVLRSFVLSGGATVSTKVGLPSPTEGYAVALPRHTAEILFAENDSLGDFIAGYYVTHEAVLAQTNRYLGVWDNEDQLVLDVVEVFAEHATARSTAVERGELCYYNLSTGEVLDTPQK